MTVTGQPTPGRATAWGADTPIDEQQARDRLLDAAEACYADRGPSRTRMSDIAHRAGVHRTTVYSYFPNKDAVLAACFVRAVTEVLEAAEPCWHTDEPFLEQLVQAMLIGMEAGRRSPTMRRLIAEQEAGRTFRAAEASELWRRDLAENLGQRIAAAAATGQVRDDVSPETMAHWVTRIAFSLIAEPARPEDGRDEGILRTFLIASLAPPTNNR